MNNTPDDFIISINPHNLSVNDAYKNEPMSTMYESENIFDEGLPYSYYPSIDIENENFITDDDIEKLTAKIRLLTNIDSNKAIDVETIAIRLGFEILKTTFQDANISGKIEISPQNKRIYVNESDSVFRQRFTIAHELGHAILNKETHKVDYRKYDRGYNKVEFQANLFASSLLMPINVVFAMWNSSCNLKTLSRFFEVSESAVAIRLINLGLLS